MADSEAEVVAVDGGDVDMLDALARAYRVGWNSRHVGSVRTVEERDERARGVAEEILADARPLVTEPRPSGADEAFVEWQRLQPAPADTRARTRTVGLVTDTQGCVHRMSSGAVSLTACGECGAEPGDDCADPLGDRERWALEHTDTTHVTPNDVRRANEAIRQGLLAVGTAHRDLDDCGVPRHLNAEPEQPPDSEDPRIAELRQAAMRADKAAMFRPVDEIKAGMTKPLDPDPWWRRLRTAVRQHFA